MKTVVAWYIPFAIILMGLWNLIWAVKQRVKAQKTAHANLKRGTLASIILGIFFLIGGIWTLFLVKW